MRKKLLATLVSALALVFAFAIIAFAGCQSEESDKGGAYYLSVLESGEWTNYKSDADIPADKKFVKDGETYTLSVELEQGDSVKIAQVGTNKIYGGEEIFSANTQLTKGTDNAISVGQSGTYALTLDVSEGEITYKFTPKAVAATVVSVAIDDADEFTVAVGGTGKQLTATATLSDESTTTDGITWEVADAAIAKVSANGLVTGVAAGSTTVIAKHGSLESDPVIVNVTDEGVIVLGETSLRLSVNGETTISYTVIGGAVAGDWSSTDETIATVDQTGKVTALKAGTVTIRLSYTPKEGASPKFATCEVTVDVPVTNIALSNNSISVALGSTANLTVGFTPATATNQNYTYEITAGSDNVTVAKNENTLTVTPVAEGTATLKVTSEDGNYTATCEITVVEAGTVTANLSASSLSLHLGSDTTAALTANVAGDTASSVAWSSSNTGVATVDANGLVTAVAYGTTTITATITTANNGDIEKTCAVSVAPETFFLYGYGLDTWQKEESDVTDDVKFTNNNDGTYTLTRELEDVYWGFRIGSIDNGYFFSHDTGYGYSNITTGKNLLAAGSSDNNIKATVKGEYTITVDLTDGTAKITVVRNSTALNSISLAASNSTLNAGNEASNSTVITLTVNPSDATFSEEDVEWTYDESQVTVVEGKDENGKYTLTVTAKDDATKDVTITCTVKGKTAPANLTIVPAGIAETKPTKVTFEATSPDSQNVNADGWTCTVSASADTEEGNATNKKVTYSTTDSGVEVDAVTGEVTATTVGTYTITATANGDNTVSATTTVTFYSDVFYIVGSMTSWGTGVTGSTTAGSAYENYTFTANGTNTVYTLAAVLTNGAKFQILFCGGGWGNAITSANIGSASSSVLSKDSNDIKVTGTDGLYTVTVDISGTAPVVNADRTGDIPSFTATINGKTGTSAPSNNLYSMSVEVTISAQTSSTEIAISGSATSSYTYEETLEAGNYRFTVACDANGNVKSVSYEILQDSWVASSDYDGVAVYYNCTGDPSWGTGAASDVAVFYNSLSGEYKMYFSYEILEGQTAFSFGILLGEAWKFDVKSNSTFESTPDISTSKITKANGDKFSVNSTGTVYFELVFTGNGTTLVSLTASDTNLNT